MYTVLSITLPFFAVIFLGTFFKESAPVEDTITFSSIVILGKLKTLEPVATIMFFPLIILYGKSKTNKFKHLKNGCQRRKS